LEEDDVILVDVFQQKVRQTTKFQAAVFDFIDDPPSLYDVVFCVRELIPRIPLSSPDTKNAHACARMFP